MEDRKLSEKESLDIITQMINSSKRNMKVGSGNVLLYWGYFTVLLSVVISSLIVYTQNYIWSWGWMLMFAVGPVISYKQRGCEPAVVTYTDAGTEGSRSIYSAFDRLSYRLRIYIRPYRDRKRRKFFCTVRATGVRDHQQTFLIDVCIILKNVYPILKSVPLLIPPVLL